MKRELISAAVGAGVVGLFWAGSIFSKCERKNVPQVSKSTVDARHPGKIRKTVTEVYSALPDKNFPGLKLRTTDFLIPLNRLLVTEHVHVDDPNEFYGSGGHPMYAFLFGIHEGNSVQYFMVSGLQGQKICDLVYLGKDICIEKVEKAGNGYWMATYKDQNGKIGRGFVSISAICGEDPVKDIGIAQPIHLDPVSKYAEKCDPFVWKINAEEFWRIYRKAIRENDKMTVAKMHDFPICGRFGTIYTRAEFVEKYDEIYDQELKNWILNECNSRKIWYSWRGAQLPSGEWLINACGPNDPAGPLKD